ncbi:MAG: hypothetical protein E6929_01790 [Clostridium sp.]|nr:hypothetical protein [Clostridium sp.]
MFVFQVICFFLELSFWIFIAGALILPRNIFKNNKYKRKKYSNYGCSNYSSISYSTLNFNKKKDLRSILFRALKIIAGIFIIVIFVLPYILDSAKLITGNYKYVNGYVSSITRKTRNPHEYICIDGKKIDFFGTANVEKHNRYKIAYLPYTSRGMGGVKIENSVAATDKKIGFPFESLLFVVGFFAAMALLFFLTPFLRYKLLILSCIIYYPANLYLYVKSGLSSGIWFSLSNKGLTLILISLFFLIILGISHFLEKLKDDDAFWTLYFIQFFSIMQIIIVVAEYSNRMFI